MKKFILLLLCMAPAVWTLAQYKVTGSGSSVKFTIKNFGISVEGAFGGPEGDLSFDPMHPEAATFAVSIKANSINTGNDLRDSHLKGATYFDTEHYPLISFVSAKVVNAAKKGVFMVYGRLTIKNHSKDISFPFTADASGGGYLFKGTFSINRRDFDVGGASVLSNNVDITLNVLANK